MFKFFLIPQQGNSILINTKTNKQKKKNTQKCEDQESKNPPMAGLFWGGSWVAHRGLHCGQAAFYSTSPDRSYAAVYP
jgi:hypothetical protein